MRWEMKGVKKRELVKNKEKKKKKCPLVTVIGSETGQDPASPMRAVPWDFSQWT